MNSPDSKRLFRVTERATGRRQWANGSGIALGTGMGVAIGAAVGHIAVGIAVGVAVGVAMDLAGSRSNR